MKIGLFSEVTDFSELIFDVPLYTKIEVETDMEVKVEKLEDFERQPYYEYDSHDYFRRLDEGNVYYTYTPPQFLRFIEFVTFPSKNIKGFCLRCNRDSAFTISKAFNFDVEKDLYDELSTSLLDESSDSSIVDTDEHGNFYYVPPAEKLNRRIASLRRLFHGGFIDKTVGCLVCDQLYRFSYIFEVGNDTHENGVKVISIMKIGQYPSPLEMMRSNSKKQTKVLEKIDAVSDYERAYLMKSFSFFVPSFLYLRRVFEKLTYHKYCTAKEKDNKKLTHHKNCAVKEKITIDDFRKIPVKEAFKAICGISSEFFNISKTMIYDILSASIHSLDDDFCEKHSVILESTVEIILSKENAKLEEEKAIKKVTKGLNNAICDARKQMQ